MTDFDDYALFNKNHIRILSPSEVREFKDKAQPFEYHEELGHISGFLHHDGRVLVTQIHCNIEAPK